MEILDSLLCYNRFDLPRKNLTYIHLDLCLTLVALLLGCVRQKRKREKRQVRDYRGVGEHEEHNNKNTTTVTMIDIIIITAYCNNNSTNIRFYSGNLP